MVCFHDGIAGCACDAAAAAGIQQKNVAVLFGKRVVRMAEQGQLYPAAPGFQQKPFRAAFYAEQVAVCHENVHTVFFQLEAGRNLRGIVAVAGYIQYIKCGKGGRQIFGVTVVVAKMQHAVGRFTLHGLIEISKCAVGIGTDKKFHGITNTAPRA